MKAIETIWKGYRFRSRTEARWAVFLEKLGIHFDYEPEGLVLPSGPYLPDFRLNAFPVSGIPGDAAEKVWLEVKGDEPTDFEVLRCLELSQTINAPVLLAVGPPDFGPQVLLFDRNVDDAARSVMPHLIGYLSFVDVGDGKDAAISVGRPARPADEEEDAKFVEDDLKGFEAAWATFSGPFARVLGVQDAKLFGSPKFRLSQRLKDAYDASRSARFEFGQADPRWPT